MDAVYLNTAQACEFLKVSKTTLYRLCKSEAFPFYKGSGKNSKMKFKQEDLSAYMENYRTIRNYLI